MKPDSNPPARHSVNRRRFLKTSGAAIADSPASRAVAALDGSANAAKNAAEILTIGLSAAQ